MCAHLCTQVCAYRGQKRAMSVSSVSAYSFEADSLPEPEAWIFFCQSGSQQAQ